MSAAPLGPSIWLFHAGALGDHILIWPLLRALIRQGRHTTLIAAPSHAALAQRTLAAQTGAPHLIRAHSAELRRYTRLWTGDPTDPIDPAASTVVTFVADDLTQAGRQWLAAARSAFPAAAILSCGQPSSPSRLALWREARVPEHGAVLPIANPAGPIILFIGAGGRDKSWPLASWLTVASALRGTTRDVHLLAGPVELERFTSPDRAAFTTAGGRSIEDLPSLAAELSTARLYIGADTGPTHLAAQLGVPILALFGPTDPAIWAPVGPQVQLLAPPAPESMNWLSPHAALGAIMKLIS